MLKVNLFRLIGRASLIIFFIDIFFVPKFITLAQENQIATPNRYIITFRKNTSSAQRNGAIGIMQARLGKRQIRQTGQVNTHLQKINSVSVEITDTNILQMKTYGLGVGGIELIEPDYKAQKLGETNDPDLPKLWGLYTMKVASNEGTSAWNTTNGANSVKVAVLDTGVNTAHSDLSGVVVQSADFTNSPSGSSDMDGHGSHVTGAIAAVGNNNLGISGISYGVKVLNGKVLGDNGYGTYSGIASGIIWATDNGANVINMSLGGSVNSSTLNNAIDYAISHGVVVIAAAGNSNSSIKSYPAGYDPVVSVAGTTQSDVKASWSNYGTWVDIAAPGSSIYSTVLGDSYAYYSGTSMATSYVSGIAGLVWSSGICSNPDCVLSQLFTTADPITGTGSQFKYGRVDAQKSVLSLSIPTPTATLTMTPTPTDPTATPGGPTTIPTDPTATPGGPTPSPAAAQKTITASLITMSYITRYSLYTITTKVTVKDNQNNLMAGARVSISTKMPNNFNFVGSGTTNSSGAVSFILRNSYAKGTYKSTITNISKSGYIYTPTIIGETITIQ